MASKRGICAQCGREASLPARGLCWSCYRAAKLGRDEGSCDWCGQPLPPGRRRFCSDPCAKRYHARKARRQRRKSGRRPGTKPKLRTCLGCDRKFASEGPWNRFCPECTRARLL